MLLKTINDIRFMLVPKSHKVFANVHAPMVHGIVKSHGSSFLGTTYFIITVPQVCKILIIAQYDWIYFVPNTFIYFV